MRTDFNTQKVIGSKRGYSVYIRFGLIVLLVVIAGYLWGGIIQTNRATYRTPGHLQFFLSETFMYFSLLSIIYMQRRKHFGNKFRLLKFVAFNTFFLIMFVHLITLLS